MKEIKANHTEVLKLEEKTRDLTNLIKLEKEKHIYQKEKENIEAQIGGDNQEEIINNIGNNLKNNV